MRHCISCLIAMFAFATALRAAADAASPSSGGAVDATHDYAREAAAIVAAMERDLASPNEVKSYAAYAISGDDKLLSAVKGKINKIEIISGLETAIFGRQLVKKSDESQRVKGWSVARAAQSDANGINKGDQLFKVKWLTGHSGGTCLVALETVNGESKVKALLDVENSD